ncbi:MAG: cysteine--tRNA ligase, partial [Clostridia bacterium]|nr:cysteine--tRNA ligase [Clostridia bacterium]
VANLLGVLNSAGEVFSEHEQRLRTALGEAHNRFFEAMDDDFNTAGGLGVIFDLARSCNIYLKAGHPYNRKMLEDVLQFYRGINDFFEILDISTPATLDDEITAIITRRDQARAVKDWAAADRFRDELQAKGIILEDMPHGTRWKRK